VAVRDLTRRLPPVLVTGLALLAAGAGWAAPAEASGHAHAALAAAVAPSLTTESSAVLHYTKTPRPTSASAQVPVARLASVSQQPVIAPLHHLLTSDVLIVAPKTLPSGTLAALRKLPGVVAAQSIGAARIKVNGKFAAVLGVDPSAFRAYAAKPTASSLRLWQNVASGQIAVSYTMGRLDKLPLGGTVKVAGQRTEKLRVGGFGTVGIPGIDGIVSEATAKSLGIPAGNAIVLSAPRAQLTTLLAQIKKHLPKHAVADPLVTQAAPGKAPVSTGAAGASGAIAADGPTLTRTELTTFLKSAESRIGMPYVWGAEGPLSFDCSGLVQWSLAQAGVQIPRVAVDQARAGPLVPLTQLQPGDLLFYHTDPTAPTYISHVAIYLGAGKMLQAPRPGLDVEVVPLDTGAGFAGAVRIYPQVSAAAAAGISA
jgi:cell wall-associated NlpC family hydrolase